MILDSARATLGASGAALAAAPPALRAQPGGLVAIHLAVVAFGFNGLFGVALVVPSSGLADATTQGALWGLLAGATYAAFAVANRCYAQRYPAPVIALYEDAAAAVALSPTLALFAIPAVAARDVALLALL